MSPDVSVHKPFVEALRLQRCIKRNGVFTHARSTEVIALAAHGDPGCDPDRHRDGDRRLLRRHLQRLGDDGVEVGKGASVGGDGDITLVGRRATVKAESQLPAGARLPDPDDED